MLLVNGIQEQCRSRDPPSASPRVVVGSPREMQREGAKPHHTEHPCGVCTWAGPLRADVPKAMRHPETNCWWSPKPGRDGSRAKLWSLGEDGKRWDAPQAKGCQGSPGASGWVFDQPRGCQALLTPTLSLLASLGSQLEFPLKYLPWRFLLVEALGLAGAPGSGAGPWADESLGRKSSPTFPKLPFSPTRNKPKALWPIHLFSCMTSPHWFLF